MPLKNNIFIVLKSLLALGLFFVPIDLFIYNTYQLNYSNYLNYELELQKSHSTHIQNPSLEFIVDVKKDALFENRNFQKIVNYFSDTQKESILFEVALSNDISEVIHVGDELFIVFFIHKASSQVYKISILRSKTLKQLQRNKTILFIMLYLASLILFILVYLTLKSQEKLKQQKEKIQATLEETRLYFDNAMIAFLIVSDERVILDVNPLFCNMFGYSKDELLGQTTEILHTSQESYLQWGDLILNKSKKSLVVSTRYKLKRKDSLTIWVEISGAPNDQSKKLKDGGIIWTIVEISEQINNENIIKNLNESLSKNLEYLRIFLDTAPVPIYVVNNDGAFIECNSAFAKIIKHRKKDIIGATMEDLVPEFLALIHQKTDEMLQYKDEIHYKEILTVDVESTAIYEFHKTVIKENSQYNGYICVMIDVTKHEEQEDKLQQMVKAEVDKNKKLASIHEKERIRDAKFKAIGELSAGITHEINTPLTYVKGNLELLQMDLEELPDDCGAKGQVLADVLELRKGLFRIENIVESMREMSQQGKGQTKVTNIYSTLVTSLIISHNRAKQISNIYLNDELFIPEMKKDRFSYLVKVDSQRIEQVWIVLLNNALDELQNVKNFEDREIRIRCFETTSHVVIEFRDNAGGIDTNILNQIFEPFISSKPEGGMGVGLSVAKKIIEDQGAMIQASNHNHWAVFEVSFDIIK